MELARQIDDATAPWRRRRAAALRKRGRRHAARAGLTYEYWPVTWLRPSEWHNARARTMEGGYTKRVVRCGTPMDGVAVMCASCGCLHPAAHRCEVADLCEHCNKKKWAKTRARMLASLTPAVKAVHKRGRRAPIWCHEPGCKCAKLPPLCRWEMRMVTLTVRHSGDLSADIVTLQDGWARLRTWLDDRGIGGQRYVRVREVTPGEDGLGHVHYHVLLEAPPICYEWLRRAWRAAVKDPGACYPDIQRPPKTMTAKMAASYVAKYTTKGSKLPPELKSRWMEASYGKRTVTCSRGLLDPPAPAPCPDCKEVGQLGRVSDPVPAPLVGAETAPSRGPPLASYPTA